MGIHQFFHIVAKVTKKNEKVTIKDLGNIIKLEDLSGFAVAIDAYPIIHAAVRGMQQVTTLTHNTDTQEKITSHINVIFFNAVLLHNLGIKQLWVFDGGPPTIKNKELAKRNEARQKAKEEMEKCKDPERVIKLEKRCYKLEDYIMSDVKKLLTYMGISWVVAPEEAEAYCAYLNKKGDYDYVLSPDSDALVFGATHLIRPYKNDKKKKEYFVYEREDILKTTNLDKNKFIEMSVCMGCDFADKVPGVGPATVIKKIDTIVFNKEQLKAIAYYKSALKNMEEMEINECEFNREKLEKFFKKNGFNIARLEKHIDILDSDN